MTTEQTTELRYTKEELNRVYPNCNLTAAQVFAQFIMSGNGNAPSQKVLKPCALHVLRRVED